MKNFVEKYAKLIVSKPEQVVVKQSNNNNNLILTIFAHKEDIGILIGKKSNMISAISTFINAICSSQNSLTYKISIKDIELNK